MTRFSIKCIESALDDLQAILGYENTEKIQAIIHSVYELEKEIYADAAEDRADLRALLVDIDKSGLLGHGLKCHIYNGLPCTCGRGALQDRINAATAAGDKEEPK